MIKKLITKQTKKSAFSLIELSIVMTVIAIIIAGGVAVSTSSIKKAKTQTTMERIEEIQKALHTFVYTYKRLPCPALLTNIPTDTAYGAEAATPGTCTGALTSSFSTAPNDANIGLMYGAVPVKALGLTIDYLGDGFDNKFSYIVPRQLTEITIDGTGTVLITPGFEGQNMLDALTVNPIVIKETMSSTSGTDIIVNGAYIIISHGANGSGSYNINCNSSTCRNTNGNDDEDDNAPITDYNSAFIVNSRFSDFDDIIRYSTREGIIKDVGGFSTTVCTAETSEYVDICATGGGANVTDSFVATAYGKTATGQLDCNFHGCFGSSNPTRKCGLNGKWEPEVQCAP